LSRAGDDGKMVPRRPPDPQAKGPNDSSEGAVMRIGDVTAESGVRLPRVVIDERSVVTLPKVASEQPKQPAKPAPPVEVPKIESVTKQIDSFLRSFGRSINFRVDPGSGEMVVSVIDATTGEIIRQVPGEEALRLAQRIEDSLSAMLDERA
jgi:flagellar protein FlaG